MNSVRLLKASFATHFKVLMFQTQLEIWLKSAYHSREREYIMI